MYSLRVLKFSTLVAAGGALLALTALPAVSTRAGEAAFLTPPVRKAMDAVRADRIREHVRFLADDRLEGRDTASEGERLAADYLASQFKEMGLKPVGDNGTFLQKVPFVRTRMDAARSRITLAGEGPEAGLEFGKDFVLNGAARSSAKASGPLVFAGYGITAPEYAYDDYKGLDVKGKVVVILTGEPVSKNPNFFAGDRDTEYALGGSKISRAAANGAAAVLTIGMGSRARSAYEIQQNRTLRPRMVLASDVEDAAFPALLLQEAAAEKLFAGGTLTWQHVTDAAAAGQVRTQPLKRSATIELTAETTPTPGPNVVGMLEGSDPQLKSQAIIFTAHYDHIGKRQGEGDTIANGAWDNASGTAGVLETARAFTALETRPKRSVLFLLVTGEERGLLGSRYYTQHPIVPIEDTAANINLDMTEIFGIPKEIVPQGAEHSAGLTRSAQVVADALGITVGKDPTPELNVYTRSDQFSFVQAGVPSIFLRWANEYEDLTPARAKELAQEKLSTIYHKVTDGFDPTWSWEGMRRHSQQAFLLGLHVANEREMPAWNEQSAFNKPRKRVASRLN